MITPTRSIENTLALVATRSTVDEIVSAWQTSAAGVQA